MAKAFNEIDAVLGAVSAFGECEDFTPREHEMVKKIFNDLYTLSMWLEERNTAEYSGGLVPRK